LIFYSSFHCVLNIDESFYFIAVLGRLSKDLLETVSMSATVANPRGLPGCASLLARLTFLMMISVGLICMPLH
jgi:hypothetical protein